MKKEVAKMRKNGKKNRKIERMKQNVIDGKQ